MKILARIKTIIIVAVIGLIFLPPLLYANSNVPAAYKKIAHEFGVPPELLYSIAMTESFWPKVQRPWPWTINCNGKGRYFDTRNEAFNYVYAKLAAGIRNCDIGLMQVSWRWNSHVFESLYKAFDPYTNIRAGAGILADLYQKHGSFEIAVGAYHSPNNVNRAAAYRERVRNKLRRVLAGETS